MKVIMLMVNKKTKRLSAWFLLVPTFLSILSTLFVLLPVPAYAAGAKGTWQDNSHILVTGDSNSAVNGTYVDVSGDHSESLILDKDPPLCYKGDLIFSNGNIDDYKDSLYKHTHVIRNVSGDKKSGDIIVYEAVYYNRFRGNELSESEFKKLARNDTFLNGSDAYIKCKELGKDPITLENKSSTADASYRWVDSGHIETTDGKRLYTKSGSKWIWTTDNNECKEYITTRDGAVNQATLHHKGEKNNDDTCNYENKSIALGNTGDATKDNGTGKTKDGQTSSEADETNQPSSKATCESIGALGWLVCPIIKMLDGFFNWVDSRIQALLDIDRDKYRDKDLYKVWKNTRNIAYAILVPVMLVMVLSTALGFEFISAYTVKRALPRMVAAILFIALSWQITGILIQLSNDAGRGVLGIMTAPLCQSGGAQACGSDGMTLIDLFAPSGGGAVVQGVGILAIGIGTGAAIAGGLAVLGTILSFLGTASLILLAAFVVLITRQLFVLAFIILSPLAIISWIFPGNDKLWKFWWSTFSKLLLMFPIITGLIGTGRIFAFIIGHADSSGAEGGVLNPIMKLIAYVIPYALIPLTFKFAGGAIGSLAGMVNDRQKGLFDRLKQGRQKGYERSGKRILEKRADMVRNFEKGASSKKGMGAIARRAGARAIGGRNIEALMSAATAGGAKEVNDMIATGKDGYARGLTALASYDAAQQNWATAQAAGKARVKDGQRQYKSLGGAWVSEAEVLTGKRLWGKDKFAQQAAISYEMRKAMDDGQVEGLADNYETLTRSLGMSDNEAAGAWIGAAFENQNTHLEYKHTDWGKRNAAGHAALKTDDKGVYGGGFVDEMFEKKGSYPISQMSGHQIDRLKEVHQAAVASGDTVTENKVRAIMDTFAQRTAAMEGEGDAAVPITSGGSGGAAASGAAAVDQKVKAFYQELNPPRPRPGPRQGPPSPGPNGEIGGGGPIGFTS